MWFKNLILYRLPADWSISAAELEDKLDKRPLLPCTGYEMQSRGWIGAGTSDRRLYTQHGQHLLALGVNQKILPGSVINQVTKERAAELAVEQGYPVGRRQMRDLKQRVGDELRARALTRRRVTRAWLEPERGWLAVDSASAGKAEELIETLRDTLGTFAVVPLETERSPAVSMNAWLTAGDAPGRFNIEQDLELQAMDDTKSTVRYIRHPLDAKEIKGHLSAGKMPLKLGLSWNSRLSFVLNAELQVKRLQFLDIADKGETSSEVPPEEQFDIDFTLMSGELRQMLKELTEALGGETTAQAERQAA